MWPSVVVGKLGEQTISEHLPVQLSTVMDFACCLRARYCMKSRLCRGNGISSTVVFASPLRMKSRHAAATASLAEAK